jgi:hypothetical protein
MRQRSESPKSLLAMKETLGSRQQRSLSLLPSSPAANVAWSSEDPLVRCWAFRVD